MYIFEFSIVLKMSSLVQPISELCHFKYVTFRFLKYLEECRHCYTLCVQTMVFLHEKNRLTVFIKMSLLF